ncbi:MAG: diguanylate cyclase [Elusimicrobiales bacterium]|nr:diguanylate cyclase [Elusimicrobiales bacterium]
METKNVKSFQGIKMIPGEDVNSYLNPVTEMPGSATAERQIKKCLASGVPFAVCCLDIDNFHAYNMFYGYDKGDEVLKFTADVIRETAAKLTDGAYFAAHFGGDDFLVITEPDKCEALAQAMATAFDKKISEYYDGEARETGFISILDRRNRRCYFPFLSITVSITTPSSKKHYGEIIKSVVELKKYGKKIAPRNGGSFFVRDRRL